MYPRRSVTGGISGGITLLGIALAIVFGGGSFNLVIFFIALAFASLISSLGTLNPRRVYGGLHGFFWMLIVALFFATGSWIWFLVGAAISTILGSLVKPITAALLGLGLFGMASMANQQPQQSPYQQPQPYQPYQEGYQPPQPQETYREVGQQSQYVPPPPLNNIMTSRRRSIPNRCPHSNSKPLAKSEVQGRLPLPEREVSSQKLFFLFPQKDGDPAFPLFLSIDA